MKKAILVTFILLTWSSIYAQKQFRLRRDIKPDEYLANHIVLKVKPALKTSFNQTVVPSTKLGNVFNEIGVTTFNKKFEHYKESLSPLSRNKPVDLSLIYELTTNGSVPLEKAINKLIATGQFEYVEPHYIPHALYLPNDTSISLQYHHTNIRSFQAWDISKGDTNIIIGITDTGIDPQHPDLKGNLKYNYADPINGADDDGDGYVDNYLGWDLADNDNDATATNDPHGVIVGGLASASTDNVTGIAGVGFNCKLLPLKVADQSGNFIAGYEAITYAADHGCSIINCSWGGLDYSSLGQDVINYALSKGALVVAAAGNSNGEGVFYPSGFDNVICVGASIENDSRAPFSNHHTKVDVMAPGAGLYTTTTQGYAGGVSGTSGASPIAAGGAALIKSKYPNYTPIQVGEQLRVTADGIDTLPANIPYAGKLGRGRINLFRALTETPPSVRWINRVITDHNDSIYSVGDTISISGDFINYLTNTTGLSITLTCSNPDITILSAPYVVGSLNTFSSVNNNSSPFKIIVGPNIAYNSKVLLKFTYTANGDYDDFETFAILIRPDFMNVKSNKLSATITSNGRLGYSAFQENGIGIRYNTSESLAYEASLMVGINKNKVSDGLSGVSYIPDNDFSRLAAQQPVIPAVKSDNNYLSRFTDTIKDTANAQVDITQRSYTWNSVKNYIILEYTITNKSGKPFDSLFAGIYADWNIQDYNKNKTNVDTALKLGYSYYANPTSTYVGVSLLNSNKFKSYGVDYVPGGAGGVDPTNFGFDSQKKYTVLSTNRFMAGNIITGRDIGQCVSSGPYQLNPGDSTTVTFALLAADNLTELKQAATDAKNDYIDAIRSPFSESAALSLYPNPTTGGVHISTLLTGEATVQIFDRWGRKLIEKTGMANSGKNTLSIDLDSYTSGVYFYVLTTKAGNKYTGKIVKL